MDNNQGQYNDDENWYKVPVKFTTEGFFTVKASSEEEARKMVNDSCSAIIGKVHAALPCENVDWYIPIIPAKELGVVTIDAERRV